MAKRARARIDQPSGEAKGARPAARKGLVMAAPEKRADARDELTRIERLGHVVVGPDLKTDNPVNVFTQRRQNDDGNSGGRAQTEADAARVLAGQHSVPPARTNVG